MKTIVFRNTYPCLIIVILSLSFSKLSALPDLKPINYSATLSTVKAGGSLSVSCSENNVGTTTAGSNIVSIWLSLDGTLSTYSDTYIGQITGFTNILPGTCSPVRSAMVTIPLNIQPGIYYLYFWVDGCSTYGCPTGVITELDDYNNFASVPLTIIDRYEVNNTFSTAFPQATNFTIYDADIFPQGDIDYYKVPITQIGTYTITLSNLSADYDLYFYDPNHNLLGSGTHGGTTPEQIVFSNFTMSSYNYYIMVVGYNNLFYGPPYYTLNGSWCSSPSTPSAISGNTNPCPGSQNYSVTNVSGITYQWSLNGGGTLTSSGNTATVNWTSSGLHTLSVTANNSCGTSNPSYLNVTVSGSSCINPSSISASLNPVPCGQSVILTVTPNNPGPGCQWYWYSGSCGGTPKGQGTTITDSPTVPTNYFVRAQGSCGSTTCISLPISVINSCQNPTNIIANPSNVISGQSSILFVSPPSPGTNCTWKWYSNSCGGTYVGSGSSISVTPSVTTTYFCRAESSCGGPTTCGSTTVTVSLDPCVILDNLKICGDNPPIVTPTNVQLSGNVRIYPVGSGCSNPAVRFSGPVTVYYNTKKISGNCNLFLKDIPGNPNYSIYTGPFLFHVDGSKLIPEFSTQIMSLAIKFLELETAFTPNENNYIDVSCDGCNMFLSASLPRKTFYSKNQNGTTTYWGKHKFSAFFYPIMSVTQSQGTTINGFTANISGKKILKYVDLDDLNINYAPPDFSVEGTIKYKNYLTLGAKLEIDNGQLSSIGGHWGNQFGFPVGPPPGIFRLIDAEFELSNFNEWENLRLRLDGTFKLTGIPAKKFRAKVGGICNLGESGNLVIEANLFLFNQAFANGQLRYVSSPGIFEISGDLDFLHILKGHAELNSSLSHGVTGSIHASLYVPTINHPAWLANLMPGSGQCFAEGGDYLRINENESYLTGYRRSFPVLGTLYYVFKWDGNDLSAHFGGNYEIMPTEAVAAIGHSLISPIYKFEISESTKSLIIQGKKTGGIAKFSIVRPGGDVVYDTNYQLFPDVSYIENPSNNTSSLYLQNPANGNYYINLTDVDSDSILVFKAAPEPAIKISQISNLSANSFSIKLISSNPQYTSRTSLGIDLDNTGLNGLLIKDSLSFNGEYTYIWTAPDSIKVGDYFVYALIEDTSFQFSSDYYPSRIHLSSQSTLNSPANLSVSGTDTALVISFQKTEPYPINNALYYDNDSVRYTSKVILLSDTMPVGATVSHVIKSLKPGNHYHFFITNIDSLAHESGPSNTASIYWQSNTLNNAPHFVSKLYSQFAQINNPYNCMFTASDADLNDTLTYSIFVTKPLDSTHIITVHIDTILRNDTVLVVDTIFQASNHNGNFQWTPLVANIGSNQVWVKVSDGHLVDSIFYPLNYLDSVNAQSYIALSKSLYDNYLSIPMVTLKIPDYSGSCLQNNIVTVRAYSSSDTSGIQLSAIESDPSSNNFIGYFKLDSMNSINNRLKVSLGDTIWTEYLTSQGRLRDYAFFTSVKADFLIEQDTICSGDSIRLTNFSTGDRIIYNKWRFGNDDTLISKNALKTFYAEKGQGFKKIDIKLFVRNIDGYTDSITKSVYVARPADLGPDTSVCGSTILGITNPLNPPVNYQWSNSSTAPTIQVVNTGTYSVTIHDSFSCISSDTVNIHVNPLPVPGIFGPASVCYNSVGNQYFTEPGFSNYIWGISSGGIVTAGGTVNDSTLTITWNTTGQHTVSIIYTDTNGCTANPSSNLSVIVNPLPIPTIIGPAETCHLDSSNIYATQSMMTNYLWNVPAGGSILSGGTPSDSTITIKWNVVGITQINVNYNDQNGCTASTPTTKTITVHPLPIPTITGDSTVCESDEVNYRTEVGMSGYIWIVPTGGTIISGGGTDSITIKWTTIGTKTISVSYTDSNGCKNLTPTSFTITVNPVPNPSISGPNSVCENSSPKTYSTQQGMGNYIWNITGGIIVSGIGTNQITVLWNSVGTQTLSVNYTNNYGCYAVTPATYSVNVHPIPTPSLTGQTTLCFNTGTFGYTTDMGMSNYSWNVIGGIYTGSGTNQINVNWINTGLQSVAVSFTSQFGCLSDTTSLNVLVNTVPDPSGPVTGPIDVCVGDSNITYQVAPIGNTVYYLWSLPLGAVITSGTGTNTINVNFPSSASSGNVEVYGNNLCGNGTVSPALYVTVHPLPGAAGNIIGPNSVCLGDTVVYSVGNIPNASGYEWIVPAGAVIIYGMNTHTITVDFTNALSGEIAVKGTNSCGYGPISPQFNVIVYPIPSTPFITLENQILTSDQQSCNQWFYNGDPIIGATSQNYYVTQSGIYWDQIFSNGCTSDTSNNIEVVVTGINTLPEVAKIIVYPNPTDNIITIHIASTRTTFDVDIRNNLGQSVYCFKNLQVNGECSHSLNLSTLSSGIYSLIIWNNNTIIQEFIIKR